MWGGVALLEDEHVSVSPNAPLEDSQDGILYDISVVGVLCKWVLSDGISKEFVCFWYWFVQECFSKVPHCFSSWAFNESVVN